MGEARVTTDDLLEAALRMRPDRIILGELRGAEAYTFLRAVNTGHLGSISTIHADSADGALRQLALIILRTGVAIEMEQVIDYVRHVVDIFVHVTRDNSVRRLGAIVIKN